jgi:hypothetical protein
MTRLLKRGSLALSLVLVGACGGTQPPPATPETQPTGPGATIAQPSTVAPDLTPVQAPADLIAFGRLANPGDTVDTTAAWAKFPVDVRRLLQKNEPELSQLLVLEAPVEFAVALDPNGRGDFPQPFAVVSVGMSNVEGTVDFAKHQGASVRMVAPGVYRIDKGHGPSCAVAASVGKAPARLVCGDRPEDLDALLPYATRGLPNEAMGDADLHIELRSEPFRKRYTKELRQLKTLATPFVLREMSLDSPRFDRALADAVHGLTDEVLALVDDVDRVAIDARMQKGAGVVDATVSMKFKGSGSWTVQTILESAKRAKGIPDAFWRLPEDTDVASYGIAASAKRYEPIRRTLSELVDGALEHEHIPAKVRDQIGDLLQDTWNTEGAMVYAHGDLPPAASGATADDMATRERIRSQVGWYVAAVDEKSTKYKPYFDKIVKLYNDAQLRNLLDKRAHVKKSELPRLVARGGKGLPAGSTVYELTLPSKMFDMGYMGSGPVGGKKRATPPALPIVLVIVPDGERTWFGFSADEKFVSEKLNQVKKGEKTLANRAGVADLKSKSGVSGGFMTIATIVRSLVASMAEMRGGSGDGSRVVAAMPHHGETPMIMWTTVTNGANPTLNWNLQVPQAVVEDIAAVGPALAGAGMGHHGTMAAPPPPPRVMKSPKHRKAP